MSLSDIWGASDKEPEPDVIEVPTDARNTFEAGLRWGVERNLKIVKPGMRTHPKENACTGWSCFARTTPRQTPLTSPARRVG